MASIALFMLSNLPESLNSFGSPNHILIVNRLLIDDSVVLIGSMLSACDDASASKARFSLSDTSSKWMRISAPSGSSQFDSQDVKFVQTTSRSVKR